MKATGNSNRGFTLLEVMIALAIVAIAMVTLLGLANRSITVNARLQKITQATLLAQEKMNAIEVAASQGTTDTTEQNGTFDPPFDGYRWEVAYKDTPLQSVKEVVVTVLWGDRQKNEMVDLTSFLFQ
ncbi:MAG TPA: type II secretion system minor pseudopilin GspI [Desulfuromonadales bacterium]|nr:type II secretion system minor pseudopilin GspI [Desulfuromonadales bacterium]